MDLVEDGQSEDLSDARHGHEQRQGVGVLDARLAQHGELELPDGHLEVVGEGSLDPSPTTLRFSHLKKPMS